MSDRILSTFPQHAERQPIVVATQQMARFAHAYVRGATRKFYEWLEQSNGHAIPDGPPIWICDDCYLARALAPALGDRMIAAQFLGKPVVVRELLPQDLKIEIDQLTRSQACKAARYLGNVVGIAHARQMKTSERLGWKKLLRDQRSTQLDAPHWLWTSIVDLIGAHEKAYLDQLPAVRI